MHFPDSDGLRPTTDKVRETVFNWLAQDIPQARCLDAFAGSGALGLEALSRGAAEVVFLEKAKKPAEVLKSNLDTLGVEASRAKVHHVDSLQWLQRHSEAYHIIFLDPPFGKSGIEASLAIIEEYQLLLPGGYLYAEMESGPAWPMSERWQCLKSKQAGHVQFALFSDSTSAAHNDAHSSE